MDYKTPGLYSGLEKTAGFNQNFVKGMQDDAADMKSASTRVAMISTELLDLINKFSSDSVMPFKSKLRASLYRYIYIFLLCSIYCSLYLE
jgi:hypothetical protein